MPANDPTLLFANAGMNQFKEVFLGEEKRDHTRATTSQKCVRAGGKHNDLENVGRTRRHHTFFEMLGNFSFGDYFKREAIEFAWELTTEIYRLPKEKLHVTIFEEDDEAEDLWATLTDVGRDRIFRCGAKDNFWQMGDTGPCGPCSEIFYDLGPDGLEPDEEDAPPPADISRYVEIWNLVFMQFDRDAEGNMTPLPRPSIDTGMGLERTAAVLQGKLSNFESDLIRPIIDRGADMLGLDYGSQGETDVTLRVIADHARAAEFLIHDGVMPSNLGRGYVLRKIIRRALRHARLAGREQPFLFELTKFVAEFMKPGYPELMESTDRVARIVREEELRYARSFAAAEREFEAALEKVEDGVIPGPISFRLYDTFGLSLDEQEELARERSVSIDTAGFEAEMEGQRSRARASWKGAEAAKTSPVYQELRDERATEFLGYDGTMANGCEVLALIVEGERADSVDAGAEAGLVLDRTPFYAESGGQVGDRGALMRGQEEVAEVLDCRAAVKGLSVHAIRAKSALRIGEKLDARVDPELRSATRRNHTATHLMQSALRQVLGTHVKQAGSVVDPERLRFDISHYAPLDPAEIEEVERIVNREILVNTPVETNVMDLDEAVETGAMALFGEKYADKVRVVGVGDFSKELCGGTHVSRTGDIGLFKITSESSISSGVRRLEAVTGDGAYEQYKESADCLATLAHTLKASEPDVVEAVERVLAEKRDQEKEIERLKAKLAQAGASDLVEGARDIKGLRVIAAKVDGLDRGQMRSLADSLRNKLGSGVVVLGSGENGQVALIAAATKDVAGKKIHAGKLIGAVAQEVGGRGGGRPDMAEAGGKDADKLPAAIEKVFSFVDEMAG